jgi:integrase/recombinase XerD
LDVRAAVAGLARHGICSWRLVPRNKDRVVPLGKAAAAYVREYVRCVRPVLFRHHAGRGAVDRLFVTTQRTALKPTIVWHLIQRYARQAGLPHITTHSVRHACATEMLRGGASVRHVQAMLGHSQIKTTQIH